MFFEADRIAAIREMICSDTVEGREKALEKILPMQQGDFEKLYEALEGCPVTIRFLDPPLHEFVPTEEADIELLAKNTGKTVAEVLAMPLNEKGVPTDADLVSGCTVHINDQLVSLEKAAASAR